MLARQLFIVKLTQLPMFYSFYSLRLFSSLPRSQTISHSNANVIQQMTFISIRGQLRSCRYFWNVPRSEYSGVLHVCSKIREACGGWVSAVTSLKRRGIKVWRCRYNNNTEQAAVSVESHPFYVKHGLSQQPSSFCLYLGFNSGWWVHTFSFLFNTFISFKYTLR